jgi:peptidoglycan/LPS O-acetylase OafA/YrhL
MTTTEPHPTRTDAGPGGAPGAEAGAAPDAAAGRPGPTRPRAFGWWLAAVSAAGLAVRLVYLAGWRTPWTPTGDPADFHRAANLLADGRGYVSPWADHAPGFSTVLAVFSWLGLDSFRQHQVIACVLGAAGVALMGLAGRRVAGERVGLIVAGMVALNPNVFAYDAWVTSETLVVAATALVVVAAYRWWDRPTTTAAAVFGLAVGAAGLVRWEALLWGPLVALPLLWWSRRRPAATPGRSGAWGQVAVAALAGAVVVAPWLGADLAGGGSTRLAAEADRTAAVANCEATWFGGRLGSRSDACGDQTGAEGRAYAGDHAGRAPTVVATRLGRTVGLFHPQQQTRIDRADDGREPGLSEAGLVAWYATAVAGAFGLVGLRRAGRPVFPLVALVAAAAVVVAVEYGTPRFRLPAELALTIPAAVALDAAASAARAARRAEVAAGLTVPPVAIPEPAPVPDAAGGRAPAPAIPGAAGSSDATADPPGGLGSSSGRFAGFDGMRALAALGVLLTHASLQVGFSVRDRTGPYLSRLDVGVAVFFALSGFLLYRPFVARRMDGRPRLSTRDYLRNRFLRIFPAYWLALTILAVVLDVRHRDDIQNFWDFVRYYGLLQSYSNATTLGGLQQAWTLTNEVAFYLVLPLWAAAFTWLARRLAPRRAVAAELCVLGLCAAGALAIVYSVHGFGNDDVTTGTFDARLHWLPANFHLFVPGMALAVALEWSRRRDRPLRLLELPRRHPMVCWAGAAACFWAVSTQLDLGFQVGATEPGQAVVKEVLYAGTGFLLVLPVALAGATLPRSLRWLGSRPMVVLGVLSYGIYLWHEGVTDIYREIFDVPIFHGSFPAALAFTLVGSVAAAGVSYVVIERPALALKDRHKRLFADWRPVGLPATAATPRAPAPTPEAVPA